jgi:iron complex transport system substrate-binding protein
MFSVNDQLNDTIRLEKAPRRIVSLVPSLTHYLADLGLEEEVVGITKFCILPDRWYRTKVRVGGTKQIDIQKVEQLQPDLILANKEENTKEDIEALRLLAPVYVSDVNTIEEAYQMMHDVALITNRFDRGSEWIKQVRTAFNSLQPLSGKQLVLYFIWQSPDFVVGSNTYINDVLKFIGLKNACKAERYPAFDEAVMHPDIVFLSTEPYPFKEEHLEHYQSEFPNSTVMLVSGEAFSWYGSYMLQAVREFDSVIAYLNREGKF